MGAVKAAVVGMALAHGAYPAVKPSWSGAYSGRGALGDVEMDVSFDLPQAFRMDQNIPVAGTPVPYKWYTAYGDDPSGWTVNISMNGTHCFPDTVPWPQVVHDFGFGWLSEATLRGAKAVAGVSCQVWTHSQKNRYDWTACIDEDHVPREFSITAYPQEVGSSMVTYLTFNVTLKEESLGAPRRQVTEACASWPPPLCPDQGVKTMMAYRDTSFVTPAPDNQDAGDARGQGITAFAYRSTYVAAYEVTHNTSYSQYAMCNYVSNRGVGNKCIGGGPTIGRTPLFRACGGKPQCGQCTPNDDVGNWLSFPREGECAEGKDVGTDGCTWRATLKKVVDYACVMDNATMAICARSYYAHDDGCMNAFKAHVASCPGVPALADEALSPGAFAVV